MDFYRNNTSIPPVSYLQSTITNVHYFSPSSALPVLWHVKWRLITTLILLQIVHNLFFHPLRKVPGPFFAKATGLWRIIRYFRGTWHDDIMDLHRQYGQVVRISPGEVSFTDQHAIKNIYGHGKHVAKSSFYNGFLVPKMTISFFATRDNKVHRFLRSRVASTYSMTSILSMESLIQDVLDLNFKKLGERADEGEKFEVDKTVNYYTSDVISQLALGGMVGCVEQQKDVGGMIQSVHDGFYFMGNLGVLPWQMFWINNPVSKWFTKNFGGDRLNGFDIFLDWLDKRVEERMTNGLLPNQRRDILQNFIEAKDPHGQPASKEEVMIEGVNVLAGGSDTTAFGILSCLRHLLTSPDAKAKLIEEIDHAYEALGLAAEGREISFKQAEKLPYLSAVITESNRVQPSIQYQLPRTVPSEGAQVGDYFLPPGTTCGTNSRAVNCSREIFGRDAEDFRPERWIAQSPEDEARIRKEKLLLMTFGMGSRSCVGKNLAIVELYLYIAQFFRHFDAEVANSAKPSGIKSQWISLHHDFVVTISRRDH